MIGALGGPTDSPNGPGRAGFAWPFRPGPDILLY